MKINLILPAMMIAFFSFFYSCSVSRKTNTADYDYLFITKQGIIQRPLIADLDVIKEKATLTRTYIGQSINDAKENVLGEFIKEYKCDLIVQPYFTTSSTTANQKTTINISVTGYPASYKNIRQFESKDTAYLLPRGYFNYNPIRPLSSTVDEVLPDKKKNATGKAVGALLLTGASIGLIAALNH